MSAILEAVRADIAEAEQEKTLVAVALQAVDERLARLREIEALAVAVYGDEAPELEREAPVEQEPVVKRTSRPRRATQNTAAESERRADEVLELLRRLGPQTEAEIRRTTGWTSKSLKKALMKLQERGVAEPTGAGRSRRGTPSPEWRAASPAEEGDSSPEPAAPASTTDDAGADLSIQATENATTTTADEALDDLVDDTTAEEVAVEIDQYSSGRRRKPGQGKQQGDYVPSEYRELADRIKAVCELDRKALPDIVEAVGEDPQLVRTVVQKLVAARELQSRGAVKIEGKMRPSYQVTPSLAEQGVKVKQAERSASIEDDIVERLREDGPLSIVKLAAALVRHPRDVAAGVTALIERGEVAKRPGFPDAVYELARAEMGRPGLPALR